MIKFLGSFFSLLFLFAAGSVYAQQAQKPTPKAAASSATNQKPTKPQQTAQKPQEKADAPKVDRFNDWSKVCRKSAQDKAVSCYMQQAVRSPEEAKKNSPAFVWRLVKGEGGRLTSVVVTPIGVLLTAGVSFEFSPEKSTALPYRTCTPGFCEAVFTLEPELVKSLLDRKVIKASFRMADGRVVSMDLSLNGLEKGLASIK